MITVVSFGYGHETPPAAHITVDVRDLFRDPHIDPAMRQMTGRDQAVIDSVMSRPGAENFAWGLASAALDLEPCGGDITVAIGCVGGRHRSVVLAERLDYALVRYGVDSRVEHRDIDKPVLDRR